MMRLTQCASTAPLLMRRRALLITAFASAAVWCAGSGRAESGSVSPFKIVVHRDNPIISSNREFLTKVFLKRVTRWGDGQLMRPADLEADSAVRARFSHDVLKRSVEAVRSYWQQRIFSGRGLPPPELESDQAIMRYVAKHAGGIGYVAGTAELAGVKVIHVR
jgi:hypothetical protein